MKFLLFSFLVIVASTVETSAQKRKTFKIMPGEKVYEAVPREEMYSYPEFQTGTVYLRNNTYSIARLNYNALFGEMQFISNNGDTISISDEKMIKLIVINQDTFFYNEGYLKLVLDQGDVKLANKRFIEFVNRDKLNGFGESTGGSIETVAKLSSRSYLKELVASEILTLGMTNIFYIGDRYNNFIQATKKKLLEMYSQQEREVQQYIKDKKVNFSKEEDLVNLITHFSQVKQ